MPLFAFRCPKTRQLAQAFAAKDVSEDTHTHEFVRCALCQQIHHVNPAIGAVLGYDDKKPPAKSREQKGSPQ
jgi:hypothetical protein